ncbi:hypothetical protein SAMN04488494_0580 [Xylanibacter ruminicola]|uniref:Uncharacterized protein n=1 Tax=Xylanibacter ruminicola TaxID=839 RepID=A0A1M7CZV1_XYLRU|nr:hypothetical protein SAMN04488494_0580 [Xylanibacter ruminicola]
MTLEEKLDVVEEMIKQSCHYKENRTPDYLGPCIDYVRNVGSIDVFSEKDTAFYWTEFVHNISQALCLSQYINYDPEICRVFSHIYQ